MVKFPVLPHDYSLVASPCERATIQIQKFGKQEYVRYSLTLSPTIFYYSSKVLAWIHAIPLFARLSKAHYWDL